MTSEQSSRVGPAVESEIFHLFLKLLFSGSAMQKGHFAPFVHTASLGAFCSDLTTWSVLQHHRCRLEAISANNCCQVRSINEKRPQNISWGSQIVSIISIVFATNRPVAKQTNYHAIDRPNQSIKLSESQAVTLLNPSLFLPRAATPRLGPE